jgi:hypothetical protein
MNDPEFETHLRGLLRPAAPSAELRQRIRQDLQASVTRPAAYAGRLPAPPRGLLHLLLRDFVWACTGAAAAVAVLAMLPSKPTPASSPSAPIETAAASSPADTYEHSETTNELLSTQDSDQLVETDDGPAREVRYTYLERHAWSNPSTGAEVYLEVPREDVYLLPVSLQ